MAALAQHGAVIFFTDALCGSFHACRVGDLHAGEDLSLRDIGGDDLCHGQQLFGQRLHGVIPQQLGTGSGYHHGIHHDMLCVVAVQLLSNYPDQLSRGYHADLDGVRVDVGENGIDLLRQKFRGGFKNAGNTGGVLGGQGGDGGHGLDIGLNAGAAAGIAAGNGQCGFHSNNFLCIKMRKCPQGDISAC